MIRLRPTYRLFAALLALSMVLGISVPVLHQVCAATGISALPDAAAVAYASDLAPHVPCEEDRRDDVPTPDNACCYIGGQQLSDVTDGLLLDRSLEQKLLASAQILTGIVSTGVVEEPRASAISSEVSSPPVALHVVHATFLI